MKEEIIPTAEVVGCIDDGVVGTLVASDAREVVEALCERLPLAGGNDG